MRHADHRRPSVLCTSTLTFRSTTPVPSTNIIIYSIYLSNIMPSVPVKRQIKACNACRAAKQGCDKEKPWCSRCVKLSRDCVYQSVEVESQSCSEDLNQVQPEDYPLESTEPSSSSLDGDDRLGDASESAFLSSDPFSLFPIFQVDALAKDNSSQNCQRCISHKRNRIAVSCARCRRLKVRCDRKQPCSRCSKVRRRVECVYDDLDKRDLSEKVNLPQNKGSSWSAWHTRFHMRGTHWAPIVEDVRAFVIPRHLHQSVLDAPHESRIFPGPHLSSNFPFGQRSGPARMSRKSLLAFIPTRSVADLFVRLYLDTIDQAHRILHVPSFKTEVAGFWDAPQTVDNSWLAQYLAILALGCHAHNNVSNTDHHHPRGIIYPELPVQLLDASEACLKMTAFMYSPDLANIRTLYLMVVFKQISCMSCQDTDSCWPITGLIYRLAVRLGLHVDNPKNTHLSASDLEIRRDLWVSIVFLEMRQALLSGMPLLLGPIECAPSIDSGTTAIAAPADSQYLRTKLSTSLPLISTIMTATNPGVNSLEYQHVLAYDQQIRQLLKDPNMLILSQPTTRSSSLSPPLTSLATPQQPQQQQQHHHYFERLMLNIFYRRALLLLHSHFVKEPCAFAQYPISYWSSLESCLGLLAIQRDLFETNHNQYNDHHHNDDENENSKNTIHRRTATVTPTSLIETNHNRNMLTWFAGLFRQDFFTAAMTLSLHLVQEDCPFDIVPASSVCCYRQQARETILETLTSCKDIWEREKDASMCHKKAFTLLDSLTSLLKDS